MKTKLGRENSRNEVLPIVIGKTPKKVSLEFSDTQASFIYNLAKEQRRSFRLQCMEMIMLVMYDYGFEEDYFSELIKFSKQLKQKKNGKPTFETRQSTEAVESKGNDANDQETQRTISRENHEGDRGA